MSDAAESGPLSFTKDDLLEVTGRLTEIAAKMSERYDKSILTLSAGGLGISVAFVEKIASQPLWWSLAFLVGAWGAFLLSMVDILASYQLLHDSMIIVHEGMTKLVEPAFEPRFLASGMTKFKSEDELDVEIRRRNRRALQAFVVGAVLLALFSFVNLAARALR